MDDTHWYLLMTKPRQEKLANLNLLAQHYTVYLPHHKIRKRKNGAFIWVEEPLFPRYLFIALSQTQSHWSPIRSTRGVANMVRFGMQVAQVPTALIDLLKAEEHAREASLCEKNAAPVFKPGDRVRIDTGIMAGYEGIFQEESAEKRVHILLDITDTHTRVHVPVSQITGVED